MKPGWGSGRRLWRPISTSSISRWRAACSRFCARRFTAGAQRFPALCPELAGAPTLLAVGDLHVENFGTWRDTEGRLIWGVNDFDETHQMPYTVDLVRLAVSATLTGSLSGKSGAACGAILDGYEAGLKAGGKPFVLAEDHRWLRGFAEKNLVDPGEFWKKMAVLPPAEKDVPLSAREGIAHTLPHPQPPYRAVSRRAGLGSLGHQRFVGLAVWNGGQVAREAKSLVPSAWLWAKKKSGPLEILYQAMLQSSRPLPRPVCGAARRVDTAASGPGLLTHFFDGLAGRQRRAAPAAGDGLGNGEHSPRQSCGD